MTQLPFSEDQAYQYGMVVDFLAAVLGNNEAKARDFLSPDFSSRVPNPRQAVGITQQPLQYSIICHKLGSKGARFQAALYYN